MPGPAKDQQQQQSASSVSHDPAPPQQQGSQQASGQAAVDRIAAVPTIFGLHALPPGTKLYVQEGSVEGKKFFIPYHITFGGDAKVDAADLQHLEITVYPEGSYLGHGFHRESTLRFSISGGNAMAMSGDLKDPSNPKDKGMHTDAVLKLQPGSSPDHVLFVDEKKNQQGSLTWDPQTQTLTIIYAGAQKIVLGPNPPKKTS